ncbi:hypothetical protein KR044_003275 [Drosophila immigrans]|nr:hypothetical protein KR044_003275 [Drosophila immigrans]
MEYADCGSLENALHGEEIKMKKYSEANALKWMLQCAKGISYLHEQNIIHRDLKPSCLLLFNNFQTLKISTFKLLSNMAIFMTNMGGQSSFVYMAPEIILGMNFTDKCDVYSYGLMLWEVMSRKKPYYNWENQHTMTIFCSSVGSRPDVDDVNGIEYSEQIKSLITNCWDPDPEKRRSMKELIREYPMRT